MSERFTLIAALVEDEACPFRLQYEPTHLVCPVNFMCEDEGRSVDISQCLRRAVQGNKASEAHLTHPRLGEFHCNDLWLPGRLHLDENVPCGRSRDV